MKRTIERLRAEFLEMPGLRLNVKQVQRLCGVDAVLCQDVLDALVDMKFLRVNQDGTYARVTADYQRNPAYAQQSTGTPPIKQSS
jgi:hypothetical protein